MKARWYLIFLFSLVLSVTTWAQGSTNRAYWAYIDKYKDMAIPAIILIPGRDGSLGIGMKNVSRSVERAVGADILG